MPVRIRGFMGRKRWDIKERETMKKFRRQTRMFQYYMFFFLVMAMGCEGQEKMWKEVALQKKGRGDWRLVLSSHDMNGRSCRRMNGDG